MIFFACCPMRISRWRAHIEKQTVSITEWKYGHLHLELSDIKDVQGSKGKNHPDFIRSTLKSVIISIARLKKMKPIHPAYYSVMLIASDKVRCRNHHTRVLQTHTGYHIFSDLAVKVCFMLIVFLKECLKRGLKEVTSRVDPPLEPSEPLFTWNFVPHCAHSSILFVHFLSTRILFAKIIIFTGKKIIQERINFKNRAN